MVMPAWWSSLKIAISSLRPAGSRPAVGSSKTRTVGSMARIPAMATLRICPPDSSKGLRSKSSSSIPTRANFSRAVASASSLDTPKFCGPKATSLRTVSSKTWLSGNWKTKPTFLRTCLISLLTDVDVMTISSMMTLPAVGTFKPLSNCKIVDFPEPVCPIRAV